MINRIPFKYYSFKPTILFCLLIGSVFHAFSQDSLRNKLEIGCHATYFFDERGLEFGDLYPAFPFFMFQSFAYSRCIKESSLEKQFKLIIFISRSRMLEYDQKRIVNKSFEESYGYLNFNLLWAPYDLKWSKSYVTIGLIYRSGVELFNVSFNHFESVMSNRFSEDHGLSAGFRIESKPFYNLYLFIQPQYNFYVFKEHEAFLRHELIGNARIGYKFGK